MQLQQINQSTIKTKSKCLETRVTPQVKSFLQEATKLSTLGSQAFANALIQPTKPNRALKNAYSKFKKEVFSKSLLNK